MIPGRDDGLVKTGPALARVGEFAAFLGEDFDEALPLPRCARRRVSGVRLAQKTGWPTWRRART